MTAPRATPPLPQEDSGPADRFALRPRDFAIIVAVWSVLALVAIAGRVLDPRIPGLAPEITRAAVRLTLVEYALWMLLTPPLLWFAARLTEDEQHRLWHALLAIVVGVLLALVIDAAVETMRESALRPVRRRRRMPPGPMRLLRGRPLGDLGFVDDLMVYFAILFAGAARAAMLRDAWRLREATRLQAHAARLQAQLADARLGALRAQLDPHFLFNTLNAVSAMVERDPRGVRRMVSRLSELLRHSLESTAEEVPLQRELELLDRYLDIMRVRFGERLRVTIEAAPGTREALVPNLVLQPLVENAVKYAVAPREGGGTIAVTAAREGDRLVVRVRDDGPGPGASSAPAGQGVGLRNAAARLAALYEEAQHLQLRPGLDGVGAVAEISLPFHTSPT